MTHFLSSFPPENVVSRDRCGGSVPRQPPGHFPHSRLNVVLNYWIPPPHTVQLVRRANCAIHFYGFLGFMLLHIVLLTDAAAVLVLKVGHI